MSGSPTEQRNEIDSTTDAALDSAARMLVNARMPLIYGLSQATLEAQAVAVDIAESLRCIIDTPASTFAQQRGTTLQLYGGAHTTMGELSKYCDTIISLQTTWKLSCLKDPLYAGNPDDLQINYLEHCQPTRGSREENDEDKAKEDTEFEKDFKFLNAPPAEVGLRLDEMLVFISGGVAGLTKLRTRTSQNRNIADDAKWNRLYEACNDSSYPVIEYSPQMLRYWIGSHETSAIVSKLDQIAILKTQNGRAAAGEGLLYHSLQNKAGADYILTARTGAPCAISFASGHAELSPLDFSAEAALTRELADIVLFVGNPDVYDPIQLNDVLLPWILLGFKCPILAGKIQSENDFIQSRCFDTQENGTVLREDGVPLPLRPTEKSDLPSMESLLKSLLEKIKNRKRNS